MVKNKLEKLFSESMHADKQLWGMKLISNPLTHQNTPADYIVDYYRNRTKIDLTKEQIFVAALIECKETACEDSKDDRFPFKRLRQLHDLINFENIRVENHKSFVCLAFHESRWDKSEVYLVPIHLMQRIIITFAENGRLSLNRFKAATLLSGYRLKMKNGLLDLSILYSEEYL